jgi:hypothetical protein
MYTTIIGRIPEAVRKHVFSKMPIRVLHFTNIPGDSGSKLQITLLDRNGVCDRVIREIHARSSIIHRYIKELCKGIKEDTQILHDVAVRSIVLENTKYAILSHTWLRESDSEISYGDWQIGQHDTQKPGYQKLANFCKSAWIDHGLSFGWMDTVCINKDSSSELDESIRSMYKWYQDSDVCISYLAGTVTLGDVHRDAWFTRGWTFQELLAPRRMSFYNKDWKKFVRYSDPGNKYNPYILKQIYKATTITEDELRFPTKLSISRKMQLAAKRNVMREEDIAYSLMGICNVSISIAYGEGARRAFFRLMTEVLNTSSQVVDFFNCAQTDGRSIIPSGPSAYLQCSEAIMSTSPWHSSPIEPLLLTHVGLRTPILLMPSLRENDNCLESKPIGNYHAKLHLSALESINVGVYHVLDKGIRKSTAGKRQDLSWARNGLTDYDLHSTEMRWSFGILNFGGDTSTIHYRDRCLALCFKVNRLGGVGQVDWSSTSGLQFVRICTKEPIVFHLMKHGASTLGAGNVPYPIKRSELAMHGITLTTMYL